MKSDRLIVKHAVGGRVFLDTTAAEDYNLHYAEDGGEWRLEVETPFKDWVHQLLFWKNELNVFLFPAGASDEPVRKLWFYVAEDGAAYDSEKHKLTIQGHSFIEYVPSSFGFTS